MTFTTPIHINEQSVDRVLGVELPVLLVFWRKDCPPCQQIDPALRQLAADYAGKALVAKVDVQDNAGLARRYAVSQLPELIVVRGAQELARAHGAAEEQALRGWLSGLLAGEPRPAAPRGPSVPLNAGQASPRVAGAAAGGQPSASGRAPSQPSANGGPITLTDATFDQVLRASDTPVLVDFWAPWCGPCRAVAPTVERLAQEFAGQAVVAKLNVDDNPRTAQRFRITGIPALYIFKRGQVAERLVGAQPASVLRQALARHTGRR
jgi:thioredoxin 1